MISYLQGKILWKDSDYIILETNRVGYRVYVPEVLYAQLEEGQDGVELFCSLQIHREETIELYGLPSFESLKLFEAFRDVSGIGPRAAMVLASLGKPEDIKKAIDQRNTAYFRGIKGIGEKKIQKLILELTGKVGGFESTRPSSGNEVVDSLVNLGFPKSKVKDVLAQLPPDIESPELQIKEALKLLGR